LSSETSAIRLREGLPLATLSEYLHGKLDGAESAIHVEQFSDGHSNLTYLLTCDSGQEYVLRRAPLGPVAPKAHDMAREFRVLEAVHPHFPEAPHPLHLCENLSILGAVFFIMERRQGTILRSAVPPDLQRDPNYPRRISEAFIDCLVRLHSLDISGLAALGKPDGFLARQVEGWTERWNRARTSDLSEMDAISRWLTAHMPASPPPAVIHNDFKLDNLMFRSADKVEAVLDWEMATIGDPLVDLGLTLCYWSYADTPEAPGPVPSLSSGPGWYAREEFITRYAERTGRDLSNIVYYEVLGIYKLAVILQQIYFRYRRGQTDDPRFRDFDHHVKTLARVATNVLERQP
jgi:aminoglycoside phosphotransferase (APT) family kinase protein